MPDNEILTVSAAANARFASLPAASVPVKVAPELAPDEIEGDRTIFPVKDIPEGADVRPATVPTVTL